MAGYFPSLNTEAGKAFSGACFPNKGIQAEEQVKVNIDAYSTEKIVILQESVFIWSLIYRIKKRGKIQSNIRQFWKESI